MLLRLRGKASRYALSRLLANLVCLIEIALVSTIGFTSRHRHGRRIPVHNHVYLHVDPRQLEIRTHSTSARLLRTITKSSSIINRGRVWLPSRFFGVIG
jgi:hypothetical protein